MSQQSSDANMRSGMGQPYTGDEIDLMELVTTIWRGRWLVIAITVVCICLGGLFLAFSLPVYKGVMEIRPVPERVMADYGLLNAAGLSQVTPESLLALLMLELESRESLLSPMHEAQAVVQSKGETDESYQVRLLKFVYQNITIVPPSAEGKAGRPYWVVELEVVGSPEVAREGLALAMKASEEQVRTDLVSLLRSEMQTEVKSKQYQLVDLDRAIKRAITEYDGVVRNRIEYLREQASIARALGLAKSSLGAQSALDGPSVVTNVVTNTPFYLSGYEAIDKERTLLEQRKNKEPFISALVELNAKRQAIEDASLAGLERGEAGLAESPLLKGGFKAATYNVSAVDFKSSQRPALILVLASFLGCMLGIFIVLLRQGLKSYKARQQALSNPV